MSTNVIGCTVFIDGQPISDGCVTLRADAPAVLSGLRVVWGRTGSVDQAQPSTCTFAIDDPLTGDRLVPSLTIGRQVDVQADTIVYPNPDQPTLDGLFPGPVSNVAGVTGSGTDSNEVLGGPAYRAAVIVYPPRPYSASPVGWDDVPRTLPGQPWALSASLTFPAEFAGWRAYAAEIRPVAFTSPAGPGTVLPDNLALSPDVPAGTLPFTPPPGVWLGLQVTIYPASPRWVDLDETSWADLADPAQRTNYIRSPAAVSVAQFETLTTSGTLALVPGFDGFANAAQVTRKTASTGMRLSAVADYPLGEEVAVKVHLLASHDLTAVKFNIRPEVSSGTGATNGPQNINLLAGVPQTVTFTMMTPATIGTRPGLAIVLTSGPVGSTIAVTGLQMEQGTAVGSFFDGSTPDTAAIDYAWQGAANASPSTATESVLMTNRATNPRAIAAGSNGWVTTRGWGGGGAGTYSYATGLPAPADAPGVTTARRKTWTTASFNNSASGFMIQDTSTLNFPATPGQVYTVRVRMRYSAATRKRLQLIILPSATTDAASAQVGPNLPGPLLIPPDGDNGWQTMTFAWTQPAGAQGFKLIADAQQGGTTGNSPWLVGDTFDVTGLQITAGTVTPAYFDGSTPDTTSTRYSWTGADHASTSLADSSTADGRSWDDLSRFTVSGVELLAPPEGAASSGLVFSGRITDVAAEWDGGTSARVSVIAQDWLAELANRFVGDQPWPEEPLGTRAQRIVALSGQPIALAVDAGIGALPVTYRDVDRQPASNLLQQLAQSGAGILWTATHLVTGQTMWIENTANRPAALTLTDAGTGLVHVVPADGAIGNSLPISACNVEADPIRFGLDMSDTVSEVALTWKEQVTDEGVIKPADRTVTERDVTTEQIIGARRLAVSTQLSHESDAITQAQLWLARRSPLGWRVEGLQWDTSLRPGLSPDDTATVMTLLDGMRRIGLPIALTDMPEWTWPISGGSGEVALYVEGGTYDYRAGSWVLELNTSSATASAVGSLPWTALDAGWAWDEFDPAVTWLDLFGVTYPDV